jgi:hypothetical protein
MLQHTNSSYSNPYNGGNWPIQRKDISLVGPLCVGRLLVMYVNVYVYLEGGVFLWAPRVALKSRTLQAIFLPKLLFVHPLRTDPSMTLE